MEISGKFDTEFFHSGKQVLRRVCVEVLQMVRTQSVPSKQWNSEEV